MQTSAPAKYPAVRLALSGQGPKAYRGLALSRENAIAVECNPSLLVSFFYITVFTNEARNKYVYREWVLDSGAFSAKNIGAEIDLREYIEEIKLQQDSGDPPSEVFALDVIGDWRASMKNCKQMWKSGIEAIPTAH